MKTTRQVCRCGRCFTFFLLSFGSTRIHPDPLHLGGSGSGSGKRNRSGSGSEARIKVDPDPTKCSGSGSGSKTLVTEQRKRPVFKGTRVYSAIAFFKKTLSLVLTARGGRSDFRASFFQRLVFFWGGGFTEHHFSPLKKRYIKRELPPQTGKLRMKT